MGNIFITGASRGIGLAIAKRFAEANFNVAICSRNSQKLENAKTELDALGKGSVLTYKCDVRNRKEIHDVAQSVISEFKTIDVLVNNAGVFVPGKISEEDESAFELMMATNLNSNYYMLKEFLPKFMKQKSGSIFNICSTASKMAYPNGGSYCVSKFAQLGLTKVVREEMLEYGVRVTAVMPGATLTDSWEGTDLPANRFMKPEDVAEAVFNCYQLPSNSVVEELQLRPQLGDI